jgi:SAM-dependent methyltransferase
MGAMPKTTSAGPASGPAVLEAVTRAEARLRQEWAAGRRPRGSDPLRLEQILQYHVTEFRTALEAGAESPVLTVAGPLTGRVLDVGCGFGQTLLTAGQVGDPSLLVGLDVDRAMLRFGTLVQDSGWIASRRPALLAGDAVRLPFRDASFDVVICRVVLMSLPVVPAVLELSRVLAPRGRLYLHLTGWGFYLSDLFHGRVAGALYGLANGLCLAAFSRQMRVRGLWNNYQTAGRMSRLLTDLGMDVERIVAGPRYLGAPLNAKILARRRAPGAR